MGLFSRNKKKKEKKRTDVEAIESLEELISTAHCEDLSDGGDESGSDEYIESTEETNELEDGEMKPVEQKLPERNLLDIQLREPTSEDLIKSNEEETKKGEGLNNIKTETLEEDRKEKLEKRLPELEEEDGDKVEYCKREKSLKPPLQLEEVEVPFPPPKQIDIPEKVKDQLKEETEGPLRVIRYTPEGDQKIVPHFSITFSQPMIELSSVEEIGKQIEEELPISITPNVEGRYRWKGTKTLVFEPKHRFPGSTEYTVVLKKGVNSALAKMEGLVSTKPTQEETKFKFSTAPMKARYTYPNRRSIQYLRKRPIIYMEFDQKIDAKALLPKLQASTGFGKVKLMTKEEVVERYNNPLKEEKQFVSMWKYCVHRAIEGQYMFVTMEDKNKELPPKSPFNIVLPNGVNSAEGPKKTKQSFSAQFTTYGDLELKKTPTKAKFTPYQKLYLQFSNNLDYDSIEPYDEETIKIEPAIPGLVITGSGCTINLEGQTKGRTTYKVTVSKKVVDVYGQECKPGFAEFYVSPAEQSIQAHKSGHYIIDPTMNNEKGKNGKDTDFIYRFATVNVKKVEVTVFQMDPIEYHSTRFGHHWKSLNKKTDEYTAAEYIGTKNSYKHQTIMEIPEKPDDVVENEFDLRDFLQHPSEGLGHLAIHVKAVDWKKNTNPRLTAYVECTRLGVEALAANNSEVTYLVTSLMDGSPVNGAQVFLDRNSLNENTNEHGLLSLTKIAHSQDTVHIVKAGKDTTFIRTLAKPNFGTTGPVLTMFNDRGLYKPNEEVYVKGVARYISVVNKHLEPDFETVKNFKVINWILFDPRNVKLGEGVLELNQYGSFSWSFTLPDNMNLGDCRLNVDWMVKGSAHNVSHSFKVQEFRTPEYRVKTAVKSKRYIVSSSAVLRTTASYYSGGGLSNANVTYKVKQQQSSYAPPNWGGFGFQSSFPSWIGSLSSFSSPSFFNNGDELQINNKTDSDGASLLAVGFTENSRQYNTPVTVSATVDVQDINRQVISSSASFLIHPSSLYVGLKAIKRCLNPGDEFNYDLVVTDIGGQAQPNVSVQLKLTRTIYVRKGFNLVPKTTVVFEKSEETLDKAKEIAFDVTGHGVYVLDASIMDDQERTNQSQLFFYVTGGERPAGSNINRQNLVVVPNKSEYQLGEEASVLIQAPFTGVSHGFYLTSIKGKLEEKPFKTNKEGYALLKIPITDHYWLQAKLEVFLSGSQERSSINGRPVKDGSVPRQPAYGYGQTILKISLDKARLMVQCLPEKDSVNPGEALSVTVRVLDTLTEKPVANTEVALVGVDEAVLSLIGYSIRDLLDSFHPIPNNHNRDSTNRSLIYVRSPPTLKFDEKIEKIEKIEKFYISSPKLYPPVMCAASMSYRSAPMERKRCRNRSAPRLEMMDLAMVEAEDELDMVDFASDSSSGSEEEDNSMIAVRSNFKPNCAFMPHLITDENGEVKVTIEMPDNLTEFRISAIANSKSIHFGMDETQVTTQLPVAIRPSMPRFLNFGDEAELTVVLTNQSPKEIVLDLVARFTNLELLDPSKGALSVSIPKNGRAEIRFPVRTVKCGTARFQIGASVRGTKFSDAVQDKFPIFTPSTFESQATYGEMDGNTTIAQPIRPPTKVYNEFGEVKVELMSTAVNSLTDSFLYIYHYRHACAEQTASRILSIVTLEDILLAFKLPEVPSERAIINNVKEGLNKLEKLQWKQRDWKYGSFVWWTWKEGYPSIYTTIHAGHAMARASMSKRHNVSSTSVDATLSFLKNLKNVLKHHPFNLYSKYSKNSLRLSALYVIALFALQQPKLKPFILKEANEIVNNFGGLKLQHGDSVWSMDSLAWLAFALHISNPTDTRISDIVKFLLTHVNEEAGTAHFITSYTDKPESQLVLLGSSRRTDAIILEMLCYARPKTDLIPKLVKGLLAHRKKGRWGSTQENAYCLIACQKYFTTFEKHTPNFVARMWLGGNYMGEAGFKGRTIEQKIVKVPMKILVPDPAIDEYTAQPLIINKEGPGRLYYRLSINYAPRDLKLKPLNHGFEISRKYEEVKKGTLRIDENGVIHAKAGELFRVKLSMTNVARRYHVALVDYLPAGFEPLNPELGTNRLQIPRQDNRVTPHWFSSRYGGGLWSYYYWRPNWYIHENMRDERVEAFTDLLWEGFHEYSFICRATTIGNFVVPPTTAEEMYSEEVFGRSGSDRVVVYN